MPTDWTYHANGVNTAVSTAHDLDGSLNRVTVELDAYKFRDWTDGEVNDHSTRTPSHLSWDGENEVHQEFADGCHATLRFSVNDAGAATLQSIKPEDDDVMKPQHMMLLPAATRIIEQIESVDLAFDPLETLANEYHNAGDIIIEELDNE